MDELKLTPTRLDWQLRIQAYDTMDLKHMPKEYSEFESCVGMSATASPSGITGPRLQRARWPRGQSDLLRVINKPVIRFRLQRTDHILEIAREDVYERDPFQSSPPEPESKWTASFYYPKWNNDLAEFAYLRHGERPSWEPSLSTFFPGGDATAAQSEKKPSGALNFTKEVEEVKNILWEVIRPVTTGGPGQSAAISDRIGTFESEDVATELP